MADLLFVFIIFKHFLLFETDLIQIVCRLSLYYTSRWLYLSFEHNISPVSWGLSSICWHSPAFPSVAGLSSFPLGMHDLQGVALFLHHRDSRAPITSVPFSLLIPEDLIIRAIILGNKARATPTSVPSTTVISVPTSSFSLPMALPPTMLPGPLLRLTSLRVFSSGPWPDRLQPLGCSSRSRVVQGL